MEELVVREETDFFKERSKEGEMLETCTVEQSNSDELRFQLQSVFDACDSSGSGVISVQDLANISRSHVGDTDQFEKVLDIINCQGLEDDLNFDQFYTRFVSFMKDNINQDNKLTNKKIDKMDQGVFNENLRRSFDKTISSSPYKSSKKLQRRNSKRKNSQARLPGLIPLVNSSSEDELEDSFDRKIAASLEDARPLVVDPKFLVRGSSARNAIRKTSSSSQLAAQSPTRSSSTRRISTTSQVSGINISSGLLHSDSSITSSNPESGRASPLSTPCTRLGIRELQRKVGEIRSIAPIEDYDSPSSGVDSMKVDFEEEISSSIHLAKKHGEERLTRERQNHTDQMAAIEKERELERRNFQLRLEVMMGEKCRLKKELDQLREKDRSIAERDDDKDIWDGKEKELIVSLTQLSSKLEDQDSQLAEMKEDNVVLRSQNKKLRDMITTGRGRESGFRGIFGGRESPVVDQWEDPTDIRVICRQLKEELGDQKEVNKQLKSYVGEVLCNIMVKNPQMLEKN